MRLSFGAVFARIPKSAVAKSEFAYAFDMSHHPFEEVPMGKFSIRTTEKGCRFVLKAGNGEIIATSQMYASMDG